MSREGRWNYLTHPLTPNAHLSDVDIAYQLLSAQGRSMYYYDLIQDVLKAKNLAVEPGPVSAVLTQINLDTRFAYLGKGEWGLRAWIPSRGSRKAGTLNVISKAAEDEEDLDDDEEKSLLVEEDSEEEPEEEGVDGFLEKDSYQDTADVSEEDAWN